jgi:LuxR family transcriptional regulator, maltose regulon positive regulatory protein
VPPSPVAAFARRPTAIPSAPDRLIRRDRLETRLGDDHRRPVTLVSGLPGAGKTTLIASWLRADDRPAAWVSLDERHDEPGRLARSVVKALAGAGAVPDPPRRRRSDAALVDQAVDTLAQGPWVLVLDDVHHLRSPAALGALRLLLERVPPRLALVLCTRADPPVALGRMRLDGRLGEIRNADLEFTLDEATELLAAQGVDLRSDDVRALWSRTQGWAAGLRLAAGALAASGDPHELIVSATATEAALADYLLEEVLDRQDADVQDFLLRTSVAERLTPDLAALLTADHRAGERLDDLERSGVFLTDTTDDGWYRYHALFADLLRATLRRRHPELVREMHERAAGWLMANGRPADAERHARLAGDWPLVGRLAIDRWLAAALDDADPVPDAASRVPAGALQETPALALVAAGAACRSGDRDAADLHRDHLDTLLGPVPGRATRASGGLYRHLLDLGHGWAFGTDARARAAAGALAVADEIDTATSAVRRLARLRTGEQAADLGRFDTAVATLDRLAGGRDEDWMAAEAAAVAALVTAAVGGPADAARRAAVVLGAGEIIEAHPTARRAAHLAAALACAQRGERRTALVHLDESAAAVAPASHVLQAVTSAARAALGPAGASSAWLDSATARHPLAAQALIACGVLEVVDPDRRVVAVGGPAERAVVRARQDLGRGAPEAARRGLDRALRRDHPPVHIRTLIEAWVLCAMACDAGHDVPGAGAHLEAALDLVAYHGIRAPLLDHAAAVSAVLDRTDIANHRGLVLELRDHLQQGGGRATSPVEVLTDRETAVLQYLPTLMSNAEIAAGLHLSINTVKSHLKAVYRKLGVEGRRDAVLRGRELELI